MAQLYFHCSSPERVVPDRRGSDVEDLVEAHAHGVAFVQRIIGTAGPEDWRLWKLSVLDEDGEQVFEVPFDSVIGRLH